MTKYIFTVVIILLLFSGTQCRKNPVGPGNGTDTTSHNFTFTTYALGGNGGSSYFSDVAIIDENDIWAVGAIYTGLDPDSMYNAAHWDGKEWTLKRIPYYENGQTYYTPIYSVFAFAANDVWFEAGIYWDGNQFKSIPYGINFPSHVNKMWGTSDNDLYIVGNSGLAAHRNSSGTWTKFETGTILDIYDIYGSGNEILAVASQLGSSFDRAILSIQGTTVTQISDLPIAYSLVGVWFVHGKHYYVVGDGIYEKNMLTDTVWANSIQQITAYFTPCVRGNGANDVFIAGSFGELLHWNGTSWKSYREQVAIPNGGFRNIAVQGNLIVAVGESLAPGDLDTKAIVTIGRR